MVTKGSTPPTSDIYIYIYILEIDLSLYRDRVGTTKTAKWHRSFVDFVSKSRHHSGLRRSVAQQVDYEVIQVVKVVNVSTVSRQQAVYSIKAARQQGSRAAVRGRRSRSIAQAARPQGRRAAGRQRQAGSRAARLQGSSVAQAAGQQAAGSNRQQHAAARRRAGRRSDSAVIRSSAGRQQACRIQF